MVTCFVSLSNQYVEDQKYNFVSLIREIFVSLQSYHEELLKQSPRHKLFNVYAKQLLQRRPGMKGEIITCLNHVNCQWEVVEKAVSCKDIWQDKETMLKGKIQCL